jgi:4-hydroxybenzoate polyprenyltransferase
MDREIDSKSKLEEKKKRPIPNGQVSERNAIIFVYITGTIGLVSCMLIDGIVFVFGFTYFLLLLLYSYPLVHFKSIYVVNNIITSLVLPVSFLISGIAIEKTVSSGIVFLGFTYFTFTFLILPAVVDVLDYEGDLAYNLKTIGNQFTWKQTLILFNIGIVSIIFCGLIGHLLYDLSPYVPLILCEIGLPVMAYTYKIRNESGVTASHKLRLSGNLLVHLTPLILALGTIY